MKIFKSVRICQIIFETFQNTRHFCLSTWHTNLRVHKTIFFWVYYFSLQSLPKKDTTKNSISFSVTLYLFRFTIFHFNFHTFRFSQPVKNPEQNQKDDFNSWNNFEVISSFYFKLNHLILSGKPEFWYY